MRFFLVLIFIIFSLAGVIIGAALIINPGLAIEIQKRFYAKINWRMEPISLEKELRNTRIMGFILITLLLVTLFFLFSR